MKIIISPAKKMNVDTDSLAWQELPVFLAQAEELFEKLKSMSYEELKDLWQCGDGIARQNLERLHALHPRKNLTPAILAYEGIQYQYMAPGVFSDRELSYIQEHLRILSGFYGILRPFDGVIPYRLEMQARLSMGEAKDLYAFWGERIAKQLFSETDCIVNLASKEYSRCVSRYLPKGIRFLTCVFGEEKAGRIVEKGTLCKMARGEIVRFLAEHQITDLEEVRAFDRLQYRYAEQYSDESTYVFLQEKG